LPSLPLAGLLYPARPVILLKSSSASTPTTDLQPSKPSLTRGWSPTATATATSVRYPRPHSCATHLPALPPPRSHRACRVSPLRALSGDHNPAALRSSPSRSSSKSVLGFRLPT